MSVQSQVIVDLKTIEDGYTDAFAKLEIAQMIEYLDEENVSMVNQFTKESYSSLEICLESLLSQKNQIDLTQASIRSFNELLAKRIEETDLEKWLKFCELREGELEEERNFRIAEYKKRSAECLKRAALLSSDLLRSNELLKQMDECVVDCENHIEEMAAELKIARERLQFAEENNETAPDENNENEDEVERLRIEEEERQLREEEDRQRKEKEEEERKRKEKEVKEERERKQREAKERQRLANELEDKERMNKAIEEERRKNEERDPRNWSRFIYETIRGEGEFSNHDIGCVVRCKKGLLNFKEDLKLSVISQEEAHLKFHPTEEIVSNIICLSRASPDLQLEFDDSWRIAIPLHVSRNTARESLIMRYNEESESWDALPTNEVVIEEVAEGSKFVETRLTDVDVTLVVINRVKMDRFNIGSVGCRMTSSVDPRVNVVFPPGALKNNVDCTLQVQPLEASFVADLKEKYPTETNPMITMSNIIAFDVAKKKTSKQVSFNFNLPLNPASKLNKTRPTTAAPTKQNNLMPNQRAQSAAPISAEVVVDEELRVMHHCYHENRWKEWKNLKLDIQKNKDSVSFNVSSVEKMKFFALRAKPGVSEEVLIRFSETIENAFTYRNVNFLVRQKNSDPSQLVILVSPTNRLAQNLRNLHDAGFEEGPDPSPDIILMERQMLKVRFRSNITPTEEEVDHNLNIVYNTQLRNRSETKIKEIDKYAQRASESFRGFIQFFTMKTVKKPAPKEEMQIRKGAPQFVWVEEDVLLCELLVNLPKPNHDESKPVKKVPFKFVSHDTVDNNYLRQISLDIGDEWKLLAQVLGLTTSRINSIEKNSVGFEQEDTVYDMLISWIKNLPITKNKAIILIQAFIECDRVDLAEELRDRECSLQQSRQTAKASLRSPTPTPRENLLGLRDSNNEDE